jgi:hypothetical protein
MNVSCLRHPVISGAAACAVAIQFGIMSGLGAGDFTADELRRFVACAASSPDCATAIACASRGHDAAYCTAHPGRSCDGYFLTICPGDGDPAIENIDCTVFGEKCVELNGFAGCGDGTTCDPTNFTRICDGNTVIACDANALTSRTNCAGWIEGGRCVESTTFPGCTASTPCTESACHGDVLVSCIDGGGWSVDCAKLGGVCSTSDAGDIACAAADGSCAATPDHCDGSSLVFCAGPQMATVDCTSIGLTTCTNAACQ